MNKLDSAKRAQVLNCLIEGCSIRSTSRLTGVAVNTVVKLALDAGRACADYQDRTMRNLKCERNANGAPMKLTLVYDKQ